ncbi:hypothetical protein CHL78_005450 [Romboutsia weinsteinii]|uniref:MotA/TolQ/ExbB proton channel domain-containing protein n=1 Tax=Romboutsia weinsteinii TaxID=2020949 RepID=A0A371J6P6_9FIRM|nr:MotA/TolQ/ExbB proton channel family protein [Romboutsia weinsteinii]RDY28347.1 hypothetical protein CHL78_005450 [Romboutsia weinsteinii]
MNNILSNLIKSVFTNPVTVIFLLLIIVYTVSKVLENRNLYDFIRRDLDDLNENYKNSRVYANVKSKYQIYMDEKDYADINVTSFIEEIASNLTYKNKYLLDEIKSIKNASSICILLGVLGTFVGLSTMLLSVNTKDIINSLPATISSMQTAFTTSIFGIISSLIINMCIKHHNCEHNLLQLMLKLENLLTSEVTNKKSSIMDTKIEEVKSTIKQISKSIEAIERFDKISKDLNDFNDEFISGIEALKELLEGSGNSIKTFDQSVRKLDKQFNILNIKFNKLFDKYDNQDEINTEILLEMKETSKNIYNTTESQFKIRDYIKNLNAIFSLYERSAQDLLQKLISHEEEALIKQNNISTESIELENTVKDLSSIVNLASYDIQSKLDMVFNYIDLYKEASNINKSEIESIDDTNMEEIYEIEKEDIIQNSKDIRKIYPLLKDINEDDIND